MYIYIYIYTHTVWTLIVSVKNEGWGPSMYIYEYLEKVRTHSLKISVHCTSYDMFTSQLS